MPTRPWEGQNHSRNLHHLERNLHEIQSRSPDPSLGRRARRSPKAGGGRRRQRPQGNMPAGRGPTGQSGGALSQFYVVPGAKVERALGHAAASAEPARGSGDSLMRTLSVLQRSRADQMAKQKGVLQLLLNGMGEQAGDLEREAQHLFEERQRKLLHELAAVQAKEEGLPRAEAMRRAEEALADAVAANRASKRQVAVAKQKISAPTPRAHRLERELAQMERSPPRAPRTGTGTGKSRRRSPSPSRRSPSPSRRRGGRDPGREEDRAEAVDAPTAEEEDDDHRFFAVDHGSSSSSEEEEDDGGDDYDDEQFDDDVVDPGSATGVPPKLVPMPTRPEPREKPHPVAAASTVSPSNIEVAPLKRASPVEPKPSLRSVGKSRTLGALPGVGARKSPSPSAAQRRLQQKSPSPSAAQRRLQNQSQSQNQKSPSPSAAKRRVQPKQKQKPQPKPQPKEANTRVRVARRLAGRYVLVDMRREGKQMSISIFDPKIGVMVRLFEQAEHAGPALLHALLSRLELDGDCPGDELRVRLVPLEGRRRVLFSGVSPVNNTFVRVVQQFYRNTSRYRLQVSAMLASGMWSHTLTLHGWRPLLAPEDDEGGDADGWPIERLLYMIHIDPESRTRTLTPLFTVPLDTLIRREQVAAVTMQTFARGVLARRRVRLMRDVQASVRKLIACPGTEQGESGCYIDVHGNVTAWSVTEGVWTQMPLAEGLDRIKEAIKQQEIAALARQNAAATMIQKVCRGRKGRRRAHDVKLWRSNQLGVMAAMPGTKQGKTGWYQNPVSGEARYFDVSGETGEWVMVYGPVAQSEWHARRNRAVMKGVLVACPGTEEGSSGWYMDGNGVLCCQLLDYRNRLVPVTEESTCAIFKCGLRVSGRAMLVSVYPSGPDMLLITCLCSRTVRAWSLETECGLISLPLEERNRNRLVRMLQRLQLYEQRGHLVLRLKPIPRLSEKQRWMGQADRAAVTIQAVARAARARGRVRRLRRQHAEASGVLVALPGTIQGRSGWYTGQRMICYFHITPDHQWHRLVGPLSEAAFAELVRRARSLDHMLALPGTQQGQSGLYVDKNMHVSRWQVDVARGQWVPVSM